MRADETKKLLYSKEIVTGLKRQPTKWVKVISINISDKEFIFRIYRELKKQTLQRINNPLNKLTNDLNRQLSKEKVQISNKYMGKWSTSLVMKKCKSKWH
jgi:hypothetical protein